MPRKHPEKLALLPYFLPHPSREATEQVREVVLHLLRSGLARPGDQLPSVAMIAAAMGDRNDAVALRACQELVAEGFLIATPRVGYHVADRLTVSLGLARLDLADLVYKYAQRGVALDQLDRAYRDASARQRPLIPNRRKSVQHETAIPSRNE